MIIRIENKGLERKDSAEIAVNKQEKTRENQQRDVTKVVSFNSEVLITDTLHRKNYTEKEKSDYWYIKSRFTNTKKSLHRVMQLMMADKFERQNFDTHFFPGLESHQSFKGLLERRKLRKEAIKAVFEEQELQHRSMEEEKGTIKQERIEEAIAARYLLFSKQCAFEAYNLGLMDEVEAFRLSKLEHEHDDDDNVALLNDNNNKLDNLATAAAFLSKKKAKVQKEIEEKFSCLKIDRFQSYLSCNFC